MTAVEIAERLKAKRNGKGWQAKCPAHEDRNPSLSISEGAGGKVLLKCFANCTHKEVLSALGLTEKDLFPAGRNGAQENHKVSVAEYHYHAADGTVLFRVVRYVPKTFRQHRPDGKGGWIENMEGVERVPFHLPETLAAVADGRPIYICEGEKDVLAVEANGFAATCNPGGSSKNTWLGSFNQYFRSAEVIIIADKDEPGRKHAADVAEQLQGTAGSVKVIEVPGPGKDAADFFAAGGEPSELDELAETTPVFAALSPIEEILSKRLFNPAITPPPLRAIYTLAGHPIATPGNLVAITSAVKTGKSAFTGAMIASTFSEDDSDCLGLKSSNPEGLALLHFDSEQSPDDHWHLITCSRKRAQRAGLPPWAYSYCLTGLGHRRALECVTEAVRIAADKHGGIHSILIDGVADLVADVNDPAESNDFVASLHDLAIKHDCPIVGVIHLNPGTDKTRGHLGSQFERKAETNLRLDKVDGVTMMSSDKQRRAPIPKGSGPCFAWSEEAGMHVSVESPKTVANDLKREALTMLADAIFQRQPIMRYEEIISFLTVKNGVTVSESTAARRVAALSRAKLIKKSDATGLYTRGKQ